MNTNIFVGGRASGKTYKMLHEANKMGAVVLCRSHKEEESLIYYAYVLKLFSVTFRVLPFEEIHIDGESNDGKIFLYDGNHKISYYDNIPKDDKRFNWEMVKHDEFEPSLRAKFDDVKWYHAIFVLKNKDKIWTEDMPNMSLSDFEVAYGNITDEILSVAIVQQKGYVE